MKKQFRSFVDAKKFVHSLGLKRQKDWLQYRKSGNKPGDIPSTPETVYKNQWKGMGDWLGTGRLATKDREYKSFEDAKKFVKSLGCKTQSDWSRYTKSDNIPLDIPAAPDRVYKNKGWISLGDWLGTGYVSNRNRKYRSFEDAKMLVHSLKLNGSKEWQEYCVSEKRPLDIPTNPYKTYKNKGWKSLGDWLGTGRIANRNKVWRTFEDAREFVHSQKFKKEDEWREYLKSGNKPDDIPSDPASTYKNKGWISLGDWFGTGRIADRYKVWRTFDNAREFVQALKLKSQKEWSDYLNSGNKPDDIPSDPRHIYKNKGWKSMGDWLGTGRIADLYKVWRSFEDAREFAHSLNLKGGKEWTEFIKSGKKPNDISSTPNLAYKNKGWKSWGDWTGTGILSNTERSKNFLSFSEARKQIHDLAKKHNIRTNKDWDNAVKKGLIPDNIPFAPWAAYSKKRKK